LKSLLGSGVLSHLSAANRADLLGRSFFPQLIGGPFKHALIYVLVFAAAMSLVAAVASAMRGTRYVHEDDESRAQKARFAKTGLAVRDLVRTKAVISGPVAIVGEAKVLQPNAPSQRDGSHKPVLRGDDTHYRLQAPDPSQRRPHRLLRERVRHPRHQARRGRH
jgi:hypothetical protein